MRLAYRILCFAAALLMAGVGLGFISNTAQALDQQNCLSCHGNPGFVGTVNGKVVSLYVDPDALDDSAHNYIDCTTCHTTDPHSISSPLDKLSMTELCGQCHEYEFSQFSTSIHGTQLSQGNTDVPDCADCHSTDGSPHGIDSVLEYTSPTYQSNIADTCGKCHSNPAVMDTYGIVQDVYTTYVQSIHGRALQLNRDEIAKLDVATCISCHGDHDILSVTNPSSPVAGKEKLLRTCQQCHPGAGPQFVARFVGHAGASPQNIPVAFYSEWFFRILLIVVLSFGGLVVVGSIIRFSVKRWRE